MEQTGYSLVAQDKRRKVLGVGQVLPVRVPQYVNLGQLVVLLQINFRELMRHELDKLHNFSLISSWNDF
jgi:hypothetical protein